ncbi:sodium:solute symporter family protein [Paludibaculum fermentans]|uniref:Na+:solute symporter n=1 Tax=Paludibaculum fermentans TaxID=1473598 RepID=A0A7S7NNV0_PALFE|nr:sodium:solute symporter family protein [Paludibaculum fermentans]QOY86985.1 Na+:solute symporter [Paludibaculum fermentans]
MILGPLDWVIALASILICFVPALFFGKRSGKSTAEFFASGRSVPWWLAGLSMVATTFSSDTPNLVANFVRTQGVAGNWQWWAFTLTGVSTVFFYARLWRRSGVLTDLEFYEVRYSGKAASAVRGFRAVYLGLFFNCIIMASVNLAACKIASVLFGMSRWQTLLAVGLLNVVFAAHSGLWGVLVIDMIQFFIKMTAVIAAAYFALKLPQVGGMAGLVEKLSHKVGPGGLNYLNVLPDFTSSWDLALAVFIIPLTVQWWAVWYPGAEPGGGSYIAQRMLASKSEKDALGSSLFFNLAHYILRPWPWIIVGLASLIIYPELSDIQKAFPHVDPSLVGHDIAYPAMLKFLPTGFIGLMVGGLVAANSSTILTHLNWGASYLVHDFYRRFLKPGETEKHYVKAGRWATILLFVVSSAMVFVLQTAQDNFNIMLQVGAGTGLLYLLRWFWWRITAWCEIVAMISSFGASIAFLILHKNGIVLGTYKELLLTIGFTTLCWVITALFGPQTDHDKLISFYRLVHPIGPGWTTIRREAGVDPTEAAAYARQDNIPLAMVGWVTGVSVIWSGLFLVGNFLYGRMDYVMMLTATLAVSGTILILVIRRLWE